MKCKAVVKVGITLMLMFLNISSNAYADNMVRYDGTEVKVYVTPGEPTQVRFPGKVTGAIVGNKAAVTLDRQENYLIAVASPALLPEGDAIVVFLNDQRSFSLRALPASRQNPRDASVVIEDTREDSGVAEQSEESPRARIDAKGFAPASVTSGFMRELVLVAEFGKKKITGYKRSNKFVGEKVLQDGTLDATIEEMFTGSNYWGYVLTVENMLDTTHKINPATFRLDGTIAISASDWELAAQPRTAEQMIAKRHKTKVYIITRARR